MAIKVSSKSKTSRSAVIEEEEVQEVPDIEVEEADASETPSESHVLAAGAPKVKMVQFALTRDIDPAPRVGRIDMVRHFGVPVLRKGIVTIPYDVAVVLADKGAGQII